jgi:hypothetical protein
MKHFMTIMLMVVGLTACHGSPKSERASVEANEKSHNAKEGNVILWATAPDGTKLWATRGQYEYLVFFSSSGTQTSQSCGRSCTRSVQVPSQ